MQTAPSQAIQVEAATKPQRRLQRGPVFPFLILNGVLIFSGDIIRAIDNQHIKWYLMRLELQSKLLLNGGEQVWPGLARRIRTHSPRSLRRELQLEVESSRQSRS